MKELDDIALYLYDSNFEQLNSEARQQIINIRDEKIWR